MKPETASESVTTTPLPLDVVISFADADYEHAEALEKRLVLLEKNGTFRVWHRRRLQGGDPVASADERLAAADVIVLLVSPDYHFERYEEARAAVARAVSGARVIPVLVRETDTIDAPYADLTMLPRTGSAVTSAKKRDEAWAAVVKGIREIAQPSSCAAATTVSVSPATPPPSAAAQAAQTAVAAHAMQIPPASSAPAPGYPAFVPAGGVGHAGTHTGDRGGSRSAPGSMHAAAIFVSIAGLKTMDGPDGLAALTALHRVLREALVVPAQVPGIRVLSCLTGAIVLVPDQSHEEAVQLFTPVAQAIAAAGVAVRAGITHGPVALIEDADGPRNAIGVCINQAARVAVAKNNPGLLVEASYANHMAGVLSGKHWLHPKQRNPLEVAGKREEKFQCFAPPAGVIRILEQSAIAAPEELPAYVHAVLLAYDLPSFSEGDARQIASRFRSVVQEIHRMVDEGTVQAKRILFSPGGDGGVLAIEGIHANQAHRIAAELEELLGAESHTKAPDTGVRARIGLHYGPVLLYENAEEILRPTGPTLFDADALAGDEEARKHDAIVLSEALIEVASKGSRKYQCDHFEELAPLPSVQGHSIRRFVRRGRSREPGPSTRQDSPVPTGEGAGPSEPGTSPGRVEPSAEHVAIGRLPVPGKYLFGRDEELSRLDAFWGGASARIVSIDAMGGAGKTALVDGWLQRMQKDAWRGAERVFGWSFYSQGSSNTASGDAFIAEALRWFGNTEPVPASPWDRGALLARLVKRHRTLLVLDGLEPLQAPPGPGQGKIRDPGVAMLVRDLAAGDRGMCVITSRISVAELGSREDGPAPEIDLDELSPEDGATLLEALGARGTKAELKQAAREWKGHALALTLLGSYLADVCNGDVRRRKEIGPIEDDVTGGEHAKRAMDAYARWFGEGPEVAVLRLLGLFDRPADEGGLGALRATPAIPKLTEALVGMSDARWNQTLAKLRRAHLVDGASDGQPGGIDAHPLVREHFGGRLREEAPEAWRAGHGRLFEHLQKTAPEFPGTTEAMAPLYAAVVHGCHAGRSQEAFDQVFWQRIYRREEKFNWRKLGAFGAELGMLSAFFDPPWTQVVPGLVEDVEAFVFNAAGFALRALGRLDEAVAPMRLALERRLAQEAWKNAASNAGNLSELHLARGALADAVTAARQAVELADQGGDGFLRMATRTDLADALHQAGSLDAASALFAEAEALQKEWQPLYPLLYSVQGFQYCDVLLGQGQAGTVLDRARTTLEWARPKLGLLTIALDHLSLGRAHLQLALRDRSGAPVGTFASARVEIDEAVTGLRHAGTQHHVPRGLLARAELHIAANEHIAAERDLDEALTISTRGGMRLHETDAHLGFARLHLARADRNAARASLAAAKFLVERTGYHRRDRDLAEIEAALAAMP